MHELNVLVYGPVSFLYTLNELKPFLKFNHLHESSKASFDIILFHDEALNDKRIKDIIADSKLLKICASNSKYHKGNFDTYIQLPTTVKDINLAVENTSAKKKFSINSSIEVKNYLLNKNEKRLLKNNNFIILTEKEIHLIELLLKNKLNITFANQQEIMSLLNTNKFEEVIDFAKKTERLIIITRGEKGSLAIKGDEVIECDAEKNLKIVDLTGAGDLFAGGFLHGYINGKSIKESLKKGTEMSSKVIQIIGATLNR